MANTVTVIETERTILREWTDDDIEPWVQMHADPRVTEFFPADRHAREHLVEVANRIRQRMKENGYGLWALEIKGGLNFAGFVGVQKVPFESHFTPANEIGWRLPFQAWGHGYATEAARAALDYVCKELGWSEIVAMTVPSNVRSRRVMERLGMRYDPSDDFDNPRIPEGDRFRRHVLYRATLPLQVMARK